MNPLPEPTVLTYASPDLTISLALTQITISQQQ